MTLPGPNATITLAQVNVELGRPSTQNISLNEASVRSLAGLPTPGSTISMSNLWGKSFALQATGGNTIVTIGSLKYHIFTGPGSFVVSAAGPGSVNYLVVAGVDFGGWVLTDKDDPDSQQALRYDQFIAPLTKALQEALAEIDVLKAKVAALESA